MEISKKTKHMRLMKQIQRKYTVTMKMAGEVATKGLCNFYNIPIL